MSAGLRIEQDDLTREDVLALLHLHVSEMRQWSPPEEVHAMPVERLRQPDVTFYSARDDGRLAGFGALRQIDPWHGEIKSMRVHPDDQGKGVGKAILIHLLAAAKERGYRRVSLETGRAAAFVPAHRLYEAHGFRECAPFGDYEQTPFSMCMTKEL